MSEAQAGSKSDSAAGGGDAKGDSKAGGSEWLKNLPALIAAIAALVTSVAALRKPPDTTAAKASYEELSKLVSKLEDSSDQNHQDIIALRNFLEGYLRANGKLVAEATPVPAVQEPGKAPSKPSKGDSGGTKTAGKQGKASDAIAATGTAPPQPKPAEPPPPGIAGEKPAPGEAAAAAAPMLRDPDSGAYLIPKIRRRAPLPAPRGFQQIVKELKEQDGPGKDTADKAAPGAKDEPAKDK